MRERVQKLIAAAGLCSRRRAEEWIVQGKVTVNGDLARLGDTADPETDLILIDGAPLPAAPKETVTVLLNKPRGVVTTLADEKGRRTVSDLLPPELGRLYPVGRLDRFSEGLLLMTNNGDLANRLTHPAGEVKKTYRLWVSGWHEGALEALRRPIVLDGRKIAPPTVRLLWAKDSGEMQNAKCKMQNEASVGYDHAREAGRSFRSNPGGEQNTAALEITIHEGRNRQIRRMAEAAGLTVTRLKRVAEGGLTLGELKPGEWRILTQEEIKALEKDN